MGRFHLPVRIWVPLAVPGTLLIIGMCGYKAIEGSHWSWFDSLYMSAITLTTVGYGETHPLSQEGRVFTIFYLFTGVFLLFFTATELIRAAVNGEFREILGRDRVEHTLAEIRDHIIVCGLGRMGRLVCQELERHEIPHVIIDRDAGLLEEIQTKFGTPIHGDATLDEILKHAGVDRARALITVLPSDADNLYITLSARVLNDKLMIIARAEEELAEAKLRRVGANQVVSPYVMGGHRVAQAVLRPTVGHFLERAMRRDTDDYQIEELLVEAGSPICGNSLRESHIHQKLGIVVLTIKKFSGEMVYNPQGDTVIEAGSILIVVGHRNQLKELERFVQNPQKNRTSGNG